MKIVFMGTPEFAVPSLGEIVAQGHEVLAVYTQPPRPAGRGKRVRKSPVHQFAELMGLPVRTPESFRKSKVIDELEALNADVACVVAYGQILPKRALAAPTHGCLNLHGSLLPRWRGAAPIQRAIMAGDQETAAQIMKMEPGLDTGPVLLSEMMEIRKTDTAGSLSERMSQVGARMWAPALAAVGRGSLSMTEQVGEPVYAEKISKAEAEIDWSRSAAELDCHIRGLNPFPGAFTFAEGKRLKIWAVERAEADGAPGVLNEDIVSCGQGGLRLITVQPEGKSRMAAGDWLNGVEVRTLG